MMTSTLLPLLLSSASLPALPSVEAVQALAPRPAMATAIQAKATASLPAPVIAAPVAPPIQSSPAVSGVEVIQARAPAPDPASDRDAVIEKLSKALSSTKTAQGKFVQSDPNDPRANASGSFYISRPGKVRFEYASPEPMFIVSDGVSLSIEEPKRKSFDAIPLKSHPLSLFLQSNIDLKKDGNVKDVSQANGSWFVTLVDTTGEAEGRMILEFRASDFELLGWRVIDAAGAETVTRLSGVTTNASLKSALFIVKDPADRGDDRR